MKTLHTTRIVYQIHPWDSIPAEILAAFYNSCDLERSTIDRKILTFSSSSEKPAKKIKRVQKRLRFGDSSFHNPSDPSKIAVREPLSDKIGREIPATPIIEVLDPLFKIGGALGFSSRWSAHIGGTRDSLLDQLMTTTITIEQLTTDFKNIIAKFEKGQCAILGYKSSFKLKPTYPEYVLRTNSITFVKEWVLTGKSFPLLPKFRLYLIKIIRDQDFAARTIQKAWTKSTHA